MKHLKQFIVVCIVLLSIFLLSKIIVSAININDVIVQQASQVKTKQVHIIVIAQEYDNPFWRLLELGALSEAAKHNAIIDYMGPQRLNQDEQLLLLEKAIHIKPDGIIVQGIVNDQYAKLIDKAYELNIPIVTVDADSIGSKRIAYIGTNQQEAGTLLGEYIVGNDKKQQFIGVIVGSLVAENQKERLAGLTSVIEQSRNSVIIDVRSSNISRIKAADETVQLMQQYPYINTIVGLSSLDAAGIIDGLVHIKKDTPALQVFGFDQLSITRELIEANKIKASLAQQPELMGTYAVRTLIDFIEDREIQSEHYIPATLMTQ